MEVLKKIEENKLVLELKGRLDTSTAPILEAIVKAEFSNYKQVILNFEKLDYLSSAGLRVLLSAQKIINRQKGTMIIQHVNETILEVFEMTGFVDILVIE